MRDLEQSILEAWRRIRPRLQSNPNDLAQRQARRNTALLTRPPRAWCLALRASDTRLPSHVDINPRHNFADDPDHRIESLTIHADTLKKLCAPVLIPAPGLMLDELAGLLGTTPIGLRNARLDGTLRTRHIKGLAGRRGKPVPLVYTDKYLDPGAKRFATPDIAWSLTAHLTLSRIPHNLQQTLQRIPRFGSHVGRHRYDEHRHPDFDNVPPRSKSKRLPPPEPDPVWYKWSRSGHFLGTDPTNWRKRPEDLGERPPRDLPRRGKAMRRPASSRRHPADPRADDLTAWFDTGPLDPNEPDLPTNSWVQGKSPTELRDLVDQADAARNEPGAAARDSLTDVALVRRGSNPKSKGSLHFNGFQWLCPRCKKKCRTVYYPLPPITCLEDLPPLPKNLRQRKPKPGFACARCHRVRFFSRLPAESWNQLIAYLSAGILYGREVPRPAWFTKDRKRPYKPQSSPRPAHRREQVRDLLLAGHPRQQIAAQLRMNIPALTQHINKIYKSERLKGQRALLKKHNISLPDHLIPQQDRILARLLNAQSPKEIATALKLKLASVERYIRTLQHQTKLPKRRTKRQQVAALHQEGKSRHQIAALLNMTLQSVSTRLHELRRAQRQSTLT